MVDLTTNYMGLELKNPVIAGASKLTANLDTIQQLEAAGASAIVCASLFEEQIQLERLKLEEATTDLNDMDAEMMSLFPEVEHGGPKEHLMWVEKTKKALSIPVIASLNAVNPETWCEYAKMLQDTGVDGLELNFYYTPDSMEKDGKAVEDEQIRTLEEVKKAVNIPIGVKLSYFYSNPLSVIARMDKVGVDGFVLFNRLFESDIDINEEEHAKPFNLSNPGDNKLSLRYLGLLYGNMNAKLCGNTGFLTGADIAKGILSGAAAIQIVSALYIHDIAFLSSMLRELEGWMENKGYNKISDFQGKLARKNVSDPFIYKRAQYVDLILRSDELMMRPGTDKK